MNDIYSSIKKKLEQDTIPNIPICAGYAEVAVLMAETMKIG